MSGAQALVIGNLQDFVVAVKLSIAAVVHSDKLQQV